MPEHDEVREDGWWWDAEFEDWNPPTFKHAYRIDLQPDGTYSCYYVYIGSWNVEIEDQDERKNRPGKTDQEYYKWLLENRPYKNDLGYEEVKHG